MSEATCKRLEGRAAVLEAMSEHAAVKALLNWKPEGLADALFDRGELTLTVPAADLVAACAALRAAGYNFFEDMTAVDWHPSAPRFQLSYHLLSHVLREHIRVVAWVAGEQPEIDSLCALWPSANYYEREVFDLFGISFANHPNLRRIMMPDEWVGHPLRKDYPVEGYR